MWMVPAVGLRARSVYIFLTDKLNEKASGDECSAVNVTDKAVIKNLVSCFDLFIIIHNTFYNI